MLYFRIHPLLQALSPDAGDFFDYHLLRVQSFVYSTDSSSRIYSLCLIDRASTMAVLDTDG